MTARALLAMVVGIAAALRIRRASAMACASVMIVAGCSSAWRTAGAHVDRAGRVLVATDAPDRGLVVLETTRARRGSVGSSGARRTGRVVHGHADDLAVVPRAGTIEHLRSGVTGLEQSWRFERAPRGRGDLEVRVRVEGARLGAATDRGVPLVASDGSTLLVYSHATWVDARGERVAVRVAVDRDELVLRVPDETVTRSRYPAVLDPIIGPGVLHRGTHGGPAHAIAGDGAGGYLFVEGADDFAFEPGGAASGLLASPTDPGISLAGAADLDCAGYEIDVAFERGRYLIACTAADGHFIVQATAASLLGADVVGPSQGLESVPMFPRYRLVTAGGAGGFLVVSFSEGGEVEATYVTVGPRLVVSTSSVARVSHGAVHPTGMLAGLDVASDGDGFLVVWTDAREPTEAPTVYANLVSIVDGEPQPLDEDLRLQHEPGASSGVGATWAAGAYLVAWGLGPPFNIERIVATRVSRAGAAADADTVLLEDDEAEERDVAWFDGTLASSSDESSVLVGWRGSHGPFSSEGATFGWFDAGTLSPISVPHSDYSGPRGDDEGVGAIASGAPGHFLASTASYSFALDVFGLWALPDGHTCPAEIWPARSVGTPSPDNPFGPREVGPEYACLANACADGACGPACADGTDCDDDICNRSAECDDGDACTADVCASVGGACAHFPIHGCCRTDADCADEADCRAAACDLAAHRCRFTEVDDCPEPDAGLPSSDASTEPRDASTGARDSGDSAPDSRDASTGARDSGDSVPDSASDDDASGADRRRFSSGCGCSSVGRAEARAGWAALAIALLVIAGVARVVRRPHREHRRRRRGQGD